MAWDADKETKAIAKVNEEYEAAVAVAREVFDADNAKALAKFEKAVKPFIAARHKKIATVMSTYYAHQLAYLEETGNIDAVARLKAQTILNDGGSVVPDADLIASDTAAADEK